MLKYEYWFMVLESADLVTAGSNVREMVNKMGSEGWELFNMVPAIIAHQYDFPEGYGGPGVSLHEQRAINDYVTTYVASFRRNIS